MTSTTLWTADERYTQNLPVLEIGTIAIAATD